MDDMVAAGIELDYDELEELDEARAIVSNEHSEGSNPKATDTNQRKAYKIHGRVIMAWSGPIPLLDSHPHVDGVASYARKRRAPPPSFHTWSHDDAMGQSYRFAGYVTVFCRPNTFLSEELVHQASESASNPLDSCLGACVGVHPGNSKDWHQHNGLRSQLAKILLRGSIGQYNIVGPG